MGLVTLEDAKEHLNITDSTHDVELQGFIDASTQFVTYITGPVVPTTFTNEVHDGGWPTIVLFNPPIISVQSVTEHLGPTSYALSLQPPGSTSDNYGYSLDDPESGILVRRSGAGTPMAFWGGRRSVVVTYLAGRATVPADIRMATLEDLRGLYQQTQQGGRPSYGSNVASDDSWSVGPMRLFPRLEALLEGPSRTQSIA